jgi:hypothetical protein
MQSNTRETERSNRDSQEVPRRGQMDEEEARGVIHEHHAQVCVSQQVYEAFEHVNI